MSVDAYGYDPGVHHHELRPLVGSAVRVSVPDGTEHTGTLLSVTRHSVWIIQDGKDLFIMFPAEVTRT